MSTAIGRRRYLTNFEVHRLPHLFTDTLVIGAGIAGLRAAIVAADAGDVLVIAKESVDVSSSNLAQGGIAAATDAADSPRFHAEDTIATAGEIGDERIIHRAVREAPEHVRELIEWGARFDRVGDHLAAVREGGHRTARVLHADGDATGREIVRTLLERARRSSRIRIFEHCFAIDLLTGDGRALGVVTYHPKYGHQMFWATTTILASGGVGRVYRETTNPPVATGDGMAMAYRAGARIADMEFMQFHPTVLYVAGSSRSLVSEAVRGEGAYLRDRTGKRFMPEFDPLAELAPRDIVAKAIVTQMARTQHPCVYLDQSHLDPVKVKQRFPGIAAACEKYGLDFARDPVPVRPGAHYMVGGVLTDLDGRTSLPGLWAAGEAAASGLHGANRLASNSLLEALVFGYYCGKGASDAATDAAQSYHALPLRHHAPQPAGEDLDLRDIRNALSSLMFRDVGIERDARGLASALENVRFWQQYVLGREFRRPEGWELQNLLVVARLIIESAQARRESRGTHNRSDFPDRDDGNWLCRLVIERGASSPTRMPIVASPADAGGGLPSPLVPSGSAAPPRQAQPQT